ncbi:MULTISPECIES: GNAT family N-acetyltransferase [unclassified Mesorhizobium]|uniref:GNAT family N-acetyltransferase n=2 Tax=Mesorhizobium TaxID=68287 RepID=UPI000FE69FC7|nr:MULTISPECIES: GNAT family N-acetyltransferase [unclassified Mesorhizobium]RWB28064.1 MAG: GNAT family N-acetyltransferase [Mesorhizobium sp.]RWD39042.1 MAG: GNAT family N-acetyltransferase [Mesorhizobium sp.]RWD45809.1 MAG: GNAT family N-acetyltransferase [Mesorhizobium sp.]RWD81656.1 MAG: GNAT family N-acetyltransferase [Mesorhizobium sp.]RWF02733.1 MAG: GNAT family N-acetyltransferase [Mesorhizobium sp.]
MRRTIRTLALEDVEILVDWAAAEGWNPGLVDAVAFQAADPEGFIGAFVDGEMVAGISAVAYGDDFGFIGLYICRPDRRGEGHGKAVWDAGMARLGDRTIGLDGVVEQQANYRSMGFAPVYRTIRFVGSPNGPAEVDSGVCVIGPELIPDVLDYDRRFFPASRRSFLDHWLRPPHMALAIVRDGTIEGYGVARRCRDGCKIGPLFSNSLDAATRLFAAFANASGPGNVHLDVPETSGSFAALLSLAGLQPGFETARMYKGKAPQLMQSGVFAITTLELG